MANPMNWPVELPDVAKDDPQGDVKKALLQGQLELNKLNRQYEIDMEKAFWDNHYKLAQAVHNAYLDVAKGQVDRANSSAEFVQKAASAIAAVYSSVLGLSFIVNTTLKAPLPARGIVASIFLGLSIFLATAFRAYITKPADIPEPNGTGLIPEQERAQRNTFITWARSGPLAREYWLQTSVVSLGIGVISLPLPYLQVSDGVLVPGIVIGILTTFMLPGLLKATT